MWLYDSFTASRKNANVGSALKPAEKNLDVTLALQPAVKKLSRRQTYDRQDLVRERKKLQTRQRRLNEKFLCECHLLT